MIVKQLESLGFCIKACFDGPGDSMGGLIETHITPIDEMEIDNLKEIHAEVATTPEILIQFRTFELIQEGEITAPQNLRVFHGDSHHSIEGPSNRL